MSKVLIVVTSHDQLGETGKPTGYYLPEVTHPYDALARQGFAVDFASPRGGRAPMDPASLDLDDPVTKAFVDDAALHGRLNNTLAPEQLKPEEYDGILFAGGHGTMWDFPDNAPLARLAAAIYERGGVVGAVCHGPAALVNLQLSDGRYLVAGKQVAGFSDEEEAAVGLTGVVPFLLEARLRERGGQYTKADTFQPHVAVDERLVTGQNPASAKGVGEEMAKLLKQLPRPQKAPSFQQGMRLTSGG